MGRASVLWRGLQRLRPTSPLAAAAYAAWRIAWCTAWSGAVAHLGGLLEDELRVRRRLEADHRVARGLERNGLAAAPARILQQKEGERGEQGVYSIGAMKEACMGAALTPGIASGPKCPWPGVSS